MKTKFFQILVLILSATNATHAQNYECKWAVSAIGKDNDRGSKIAADADGNIIVTGRFRSKDITFGNIKLTNSDQDSSTSDAFVIKYSPDANVLWAKRFGGYGDDFGFHCETDKNGNIVVVGGYDCDTMAIGKHTFINKRVNGRGSGVFVTKLSDDGDIIWAKSLGGAGFQGGDYSTCVLDKSGNIYLASKFRSEKCILDSIVLTNTGKGDEAFFAKLSSEGKVIWAKSAQGAGWDELQSCDIDPQGNLIIGGWFAGATIIFDHLTLKNAGEKSPDVFVAKYSPEGNLIWAKSYGDYAPELATCHTDGKGNIFLAGGYLDSALTVGKTTLTNKGSGDIMIIKLDSNGDVVWAISEGGNSKDFIYNFHVDANDNCIVTGGYSSTDFALGKTTLTNSDSNTENIFIASYSADGKLLWAKGANGTGRNVGRDCVTDKKGNIYLTGSFDAKTLSFESLTLTNSGDADVYIVKLVPGK